MNGLLWIAQILLAGIFLFTGMTKLLAYNSLVASLESRPRRKPINISRGQASLIACAEIAGAVALVMPAVFTPPALAPDYLLIRLAAAGLALLMVAAGIYHLVRKEPAAPSVVLFLLALFIIVGRWPH